MAELKSRGSLASSANETRGHCDHRNPRQIFGPHGGGHRQGLLMAPARIAQALSPWLFGLALDRSGSGALAVSAAIGAVLAHCTPERLAAMIVRQGLQLATMAIPQNQRRREHVISDQGRKASAASRGGE